MNENMDAQMHMPAVTNTCACVYIEGFEDFFKLGKLCSILEQSNIYAWSLHETTFKSDCLQSRNSSSEALRESD